MMMIITKYIVKFTPLFVGIMVQLPMFIQMVKESYGLIIPTLIMIWENFPLEISYTKNGVNLKFGNKK